MTELEQYKKAYATLVGRVDRIITALEDSAAAEHPAVLSAAKSLTNALLEAEDLFIEQDPET